MFADDTNITTKGLNVEEIQTRLNYGLEHIHQWLLANKLTLNEVKTARIHDNRIATEIIKY